MVAPMGQPRNKILYDIVACSGCRSLATDLPGLSGHAPQNIARLATDLSGLSGRAPQNIGGAGQNARGGAVDAAAAKVGSSTNSRPPLGPFRALRPEPGGRPFAPPG